MTGGVGNPLIVNDVNAPNVNPVAGPTPNGAQGRIVLAVPDRDRQRRRGPDLRRLALRGRRHPRRRLLRALRTKDFGQNWTQVRIPTLPPVSTIQAIPTTTSPSPIIRSSGRASSPPGQLRPDPDHRPDQSQRRLPGRQRATAARPRCIRVDTTNIWDAHSLVAYSSFSADGGPINHQLRPARPPINSHPVDRLPLR